MRRLVVLALAGCAAKPAPVAVPVPVTSCTGNVSVDRDQIVVAGRWRGHPVRILLDTGAAMGGVSKSFALAHHLAPVGTGSAMGIGGKVFESDLYDLGPFQLGGGELDGTEFLAFDTDRYDLMIGTHELKTHAFELDIVKSSFCLAASPHPRATEPFRLEGDDNELPYITARVGDVELRHMVLDTGAALSTLREDLITRITYQLDSEHSVEDSVGERTNRVFVRVPEICVGATCMHEQVLALTDTVTTASIDGLVGVPFMVGRALVIDYPARKFGFY